MNDQVIDHLLSMEYYDGFDWEMSQERIPEPHLLFTMRKGGLSASREIPYRLDMTSRDFGMWQVTKIHVYRLEMMAEINGKLGIRDE